MPGKAIMLSLMAATMPGRTRARPASVGAAIKARRAFLNLKAEDVVDLTRGAISLKLLSKLENNHVSPASLKLGKYRMLLSVLQLGPAEFEELTGVPASAPEPDELPGSTPYTPSINVPLVGTVSAGLKGHIVNDDHDTISLDATLPGLRGRQKQNLVALVVNGDSMVSDCAATTVRPGSHVVVELGALPASGDLVAAWLVNREVAVLKQYGEGGDVVLRSFNPSGPVFRLKDEPIDVRGVVRVIMSYP